MRWLYLIGRPIGHAVRSCAWHGRTDGRTHERITQVPSKSSRSERARKPDDSTMVDDRRTLSRPGYCCELCRRMERE